MTEHTGTKVTIRSAKPHQTGYLLSVATYNSRGGATVWPGPKCSNYKTALEVAYWIENHFRGSNLNDRQSSM